MKISDPPAGHGTIKGITESDDPTVGRAMTVEDGEAGELVVKLRNLVAQLEDECERLRDHITGMER
ncbi:hypothetical protein LCGC14_2808820 [marine sediment metagenome]|uniref:Uncharacterized protein n=1 Tax=marine sediment metagenome TaxID=412755 RepID=A0A0F8Z7D7_9ZZZZ